jgi:ferric-dicitrate binding protein FerR (iron transport regulator)
MRISTLTLTITTLFISSVAAQAQDRKPLPAGEEQKYLVSAKPGIVNVIEGELSSRHSKTGWASLLQPDSGNWQKLAAGDELELNDILRTGQGARAEILLTPGVYLRMSADTEVIFQFDGNSKQAVTLRRGSIIVEASTNLWMTVATPKSDVNLIRGGLYRIDVTPDGLDVTVREGIAYIGDTEIKKKRRAIVELGEPTVAKLEKASPRADRVEQAAQRQGAAQQRLDFFDR